MILLLAKVIQSPIDELLERIDKGASKKFKIEIINASKSYFELDQENDLVVVRGDTYISVGVGINWYLKYHAHIHLSWSGMHFALPAVLPKVAQKERHETDSKYRYAFNFCTFSYGLAFWDWARWEQEIDWMVLHGVNLPLAITGNEQVWVHVLLDLGYSKTEVNKFVAGPGFQAWFKMNNLEGWGGPNLDNWYTLQTNLQKQILTRYIEVGIRPVLAGYSGMVPHDAKEKLGLNITNPGEWCSFQRPGFLSPTDENFDKIADLYYKHSLEIFGNVNHYAADPFHEGGNTEGVDLKKAGTVIQNAMRRANPNAVWVIQSWQGCPHMEMLNHLDKGTVLVLDLFSEGNPKWAYGDGYGKHNWLFCMINNFGGRTEQFGKIDQLIDEYYTVKGHKNGGSKNMGVGITMEGYELNPVVYELILELPWRSEKQSGLEFVRKYAMARYGLQKENPMVVEAWDILRDTVYNVPGGQQGGAESVLCARPGLDIGSVSTWGTANIHYNTDHMVKGVVQLINAAEQLSENNNYRYDLTYTVAQALADYGNKLQKNITESFRNNDLAKFKEQSQRFLELILDQDRLMGTRREFLVGTWIESAKKLATTKEELENYEWNARSQITVWGHKAAANGGGLHDYSYRQWSGLLKDFYHKRWQRQFQWMETSLNGKEPGNIDWFDEIEYPWTIDKKLYPTEPIGDSIEIAQELFKKYLI